VTDEELKRLLDSVGPDDAPEAADVDARFEALALGELSADEVRRLTAVAATSQRGQELVDALMPLDADFHRRTADRLMALRPAAPAPVVIAAAPKPAASEGVVARLVAWLRRPVVLLPVLMVAVALFVVRAPVEPLPEYGVELRMGDKATRGTPVVAGRPTLSTGSRLDVVVRPHAAVDGPVSAAVFQRAGGVATALAVQVDVDPRGSVRVQGVVGEAIPAVAGPLELVVVVARGAVAPTAADVDGGPGLQVVEVGVDIAP
jgi:hypothetical protein